MPRSRPRSQKRSCEPPMACSKARRRCSLDRPRFELARGMLRATLLVKVKAAAALFALAIFTTAVAKSGSKPTAPGPDHEKRKTLADRPTVAAAAPPGRQDLKLPEHARVRLGTTRLRHESTVRSIAFAPDGRTLASTGEDGVRVWDLATGEPVSGLPVLKENLWAFNAVYSPDGTKLLVSFNLGGVRLWDLAAGRERLKLQEHRGRVEGIAFAADGTRFATAGDDDSRVYVWDPDTGHRLLRLDTGENSISRGGGPLAFSPDATRLALGTSSRTGRGELVCIWDLQHGAQPVFIHQAHIHNLKSLAFTPDGRTLITGGDGTRPVDGHDHAVDMIPQIRLWDATTERCVAISRWAI